MLKAAIQKKNLYIEILYKIKRKYVTWETFSNAVNWWIKRT